MKRTIRISGGLYASMIASYLHAAPMLFLPGPMVDRARMDAWIAVLLSGTVAALVGMLIGWIALQFGRQSATEAARSAMGKVAGGLVGLIYAAFAIWICSLVMRDLQEFTSIILLPGTPGVVIPVGLGLVILYAVWSGLEPLARISFTAVMAAVIGLLAFPILVGREYSFLHLEPLLFRGLRPVLEASRITTPWFGEVVFIFTLIPHLSRPKEVYRWTVTGVIGATLMLADIVGLVLLVFGPVLPARLMFPAYDLAQQISLAQILERVELVLVLFWMLNMFVKAGLCLYVAAEAAGDTLGLKSHRIPAAVLAPLAVALTQIWPGILPFVATVGSPAVILAHSVWEGVILVLFGVSALVLRIRKPGTAHA